MTSQLPTTQWRPMGLRMTAHVTNALVLAAVILFLGGCGSSDGDRHGRFNSTRLGDGTLLVGSGGANGVAPTAEEVVATLPSVRNRLVETLPHVTGPGARVTAVVTELGVREKEGGAGPLRLTRLVVPLVGGRRDAHIEALRVRCGFRMDVAGDPPAVPDPDPADVARLRLLDPERAFLGPAGSEATDGRA